MQSPGALWLEGSEGTRLSVVGKEVSEGGMSGIMESLVSCAEKFEFHCKSDGSPWRVLSTTVPGSHLHPLKDRSCCSMS